jgi:hypothetical protein
MDGHAAPAPKFLAVSEALDRLLGGVAAWTHPEGGAFHQLPTCSMAVRAGSSRLAGAARRGHASRVSVSQGGTA